MTVFMTCDESSCHTIPVVFILKFKNISVFQKYAGKFLEILYAVVTKVKKSRQIVAIGVKMMCLNTTALLSNMQDFKILL